MTMKLCCKGELPGNTLHGSTPSRCWGTWGLSLNTVSGVNTRTVLPPWCSVKGGHLPGDDVSQYCVAFDSFDTDFRVKLWSRSHTLERLVLISQVASLVDLVRVSNYNYWPFSKATLSGICHPWFWQPWLCGACSGTLHRGLFKLHVVGGILSEEGAGDSEGNVLHVPLRLLIFRLLNVNLMII